MGKYDHINFKPPESVASAAEKGLEYRKQQGADKAGLTPSEAAKEGIGSGVQRATNLKNRTNVSPQVIKQMVAFFSRHEKNSAVDPEYKGEPWKDKGYVSWLLWGGDPGRSWAQKVLRQMESADEKDKTAARKAPSFPYLTDEYEPTNPALWEKVKEVARGDKESLTIGSRTINKPAARYVWPSPPASAWAVKQYNGFGGGWRKTATLKILAAGGIISARTEEELGRMRRLSEKGLAKKIGESRGTELWEGVPGENPEQRVTSRWKQALQSLDVRGLREVLNKAVSRTRDYPAKVLKFETRKGKEGRWTAEALVDYKFPASRVPVQPGKVPLIAPLRLLFEFDPTKALSLRAEVKSPVLGTTKRIYENHRITGDYERTIRSVLLSYQPEIVWK